MADFNVDELPDDALIAVPKGQLTAIGDAIRAKRDTAAPIEIPDMPNEIGLIETGGGGGDGDFHGLRILEYADSAYFQPTVVDASTMLAVDSLVIGVNRGWFWNNSTSGNNGFWTKLRSIAMPRNLTVLGPMFVCCGALTSVSGLENVENAQNSFVQCTGLRKVWIRESVSKVTATSAGAALFYGCDSALTIYCEADVKPTGWGDYWDNRTGSAKHTVVWGQKTSPFEPGEDTVIIGHGM